MPYCMIMMAVFTLFLGLTSCHPPLLTDEEAISLIRQERGYPHIVDREIAIGDPSLASALHRAGLDTEDYVILTYTWSLAEAGKPAVYFTGRARPYLLPGNHEDSQAGVRHVAMAKEDVLAIAKMQVATDHKRAVAEFITTCRDFTPFAVLAHRDLHKSDRSVVYFIYANRSWKLVEYPGPGFLPLEIALDSMP